MVMGRLHVTVGMEATTFFMCAKIPIGRLTLVNFGAQYGQFEVTHELPDHTHWLGMFQI